MRGVLVEELGRVLVHTHMLEDLADLLLDCTQLLFHALLVSGGAGCGFSSGFFCLLSMFVSNFLRHGFSVLIHESFLFLISQILSSHLLNCSSRSLMYKLFEQIASHLLNCSSKSDMYP
jgi:hypothetical protein